MPSYSYIAVDAMGKEKKATIDAENQDKAAARLKKNGLTLISIKEVGMLEKDIKLSFGRKVKPRDLSVFCRQFVSMIEAGVTVIDALGMLEEQTENKRLSAALHEVRTEVEKGQTLSEAMGHQGEIFPEMLVNMVAAGETSGNIELSFSRMAVQFDKTAKLSGLMKKSLAYPVVLLIVAVLIVILMVVKVIPGYAATFEQAGMQLPGITRAMMSMSHVITKFWYLFVGGILLIVLGIREWRKTESGKLFFGKIAMKLPLFGKLNIKTYSSQFARTLSTLMYAGIPLIHGIDAVTKLMKNRHFQLQLYSAREEVAKGVPLSEPLRKGGLFPPMVIHMLSIGEETGDIEGMLDKLADYYDEEVEMTTQTVMAAMEPMIIVVMAIIVVILIAAIYAPMLSMYNQLGNM